MHTSLIYLMLLCVHFTLPLYRGCFRETKDQKCNHLTNCWSKKTSQTTSRRHLKLASPRASCDLRLILKNHKACVQYSATQLLHTVFGWGFLNLLMIDRELFPSCFALIDSLRKTRLIILVLLLIGIYGLSRTPFLSGKGSFSDAGLFQFLFFPTLASTHNRCMPRNTMAVSQCHFLLLYLR